MRLNKFISETGVCSRREADGWIEQGRVTVNGATAVLGTQVNAGDNVCVDGKPVGQSKKDVYIALNKPVGITCTTERHIEGNIIDFIGHAERIFPIGRLDKPSEGPDPADQQWRYRQRDSAGRAQSREGVRRHGGSAADAGFHRAHGCGR